MTSSQGMVVMQHRVLISFLNPLLPTVAMAAHTSKTILDRLQRASVGVGGWSDQEPPPTTPQV